MMKYKSKNKFRWPNGWQYIKLPRQTLFSNEWADLAPSSKIIYIQMKGKYNAKNNGQIRLYYSELRKIKGLSGSRTIAKAFQELENKEWIRRIKLGGIYGRANEYELTGKFDPSINWDKLIQAGAI
jgi:hypothetical protein